MIILIAIVVILLVLVAFFALLRYERFAHRDPRPSETMEVKDENGEIVDHVPIRHGALDESLLTGVWLGIKNDLSAVKRRVTS